MTQKKTCWTRCKEESGFIRETIRKSKLTASNGFELKKPARAQDGFLNCSIEEEKERLLFKY